MRCFCVAHFSEPDVFEYEREHRCLASGLDSPRQKLEKSLRTRSAWSRSDSGSERAPRVAPGSPDTARARELDLVVRGSSNPENCERLAITVATAKTDVARILQKVGLRGRVQVSIYAYESGLLSSGEPELRPQARRRRRTR